MASRTSDFQLTIDSSGKERMNTYYWLTNTTGALSITNLDGYAVPFVEQSPDGRFRFCLLLCTHDGVHPQNALLVAMLQRMGLVEVTPEHGAVYTQFLTTALGRTPEQASAEAWDFLVFGDQSPLVPFTGTEISVSASGEATVLRMTPADGNPAIQRPKARPGNRRGGYERQAVRPQPVPWLDADGQGRPHLRLRHAGADVPFIVGHAPAIYWPGRRAGLRQERDWRAPRYDPHAHRPRRVRSGEHVSRCANDRWSAFGRASVLLQRCRTALQPADAAGRGIRAPRDALKSRQLRFQGSNLRLLMEQDGNQPAEMRLRLWRDRRQRI